MQQILNSISPMYATLLVDNKVTFTDVLVWAILVDRYDLAQAVSFLLCQNRVLLKANI